jgi:hypothetical protein
VDVARLPPPLVRGGSASLTDLERDGQSLRSGVVEFAVAGSFPTGLVFHLLLQPGILVLLKGFIGRRTSAG